MTFIGPKLSNEEALVIVSTSWICSQRDTHRFIRILRILDNYKCIRIREPCPHITTNSVFNAMMDDATCRVRFRFTISELKILCIKLRLPQNGIITSERDHVSSIEALAMVCRRLSEGSKLLTVASEFGRSTSAYSRIIKATISILYSTHKEILYFNSYMIKTRVADYCNAIFAAGAPLRTCWGFIDGTKQYISRPSPRNIPTFANENLQRSVYNGHPRRHCMNWQCIMAPDGIIVSVFGPVEGRRHDSTMFNMSGIYEVMDNDTENTFKGKVIYGDPAYGCNKFMCCPSEKTSYSAIEFNRRMSAVRESVEWGFGRVKLEWEFVFWDKKLRVRQTPIGKLFYVAVLLTNCRACLQPLGNQISMYFGQKPPLLQHYLNLQE